MCPIIIVALSLALIVLLGGLFLLAYAKKESLGKLTKIASYVAILFGTVVFVGGIIGACMCSSCHKGKCDKDKMECSRGGMKGECSKGSCEKDEMECQKGMAKGHCEGEEKECCEGEEGKCKKGGECSEGKEECTEGKKVVKEVKVVKTM
jgi:hypothetical protein